MEPMAFKSFSLDVSFSVALLYLYYKWFAVLF